MSRYFRVICDSKTFCVCSTQEQAVQHAQHLRSRGHTTWIEPAETDPRQELKVLLAAT